MGVSRELAARDATKQVGNKAKQQPKQLSAAGPSSFKGKGRGNLLHQRVGLACG